MRRSFRTTVLFALGLAWVSGSGTMSTATADDGVKVSGFLGDYSQLEEHPDQGRTAKTYIAPGLNLQEYKRVYVAFPLVQLTSTERQVAVDPRDLTELAQYFHDKMTDAIEEHYEIAQEPGPGVLVVRTAIINVDPINRAAGITGKVVLKVVNLEMGGAAIEADIVDGESGERLAALVEIKEGSRVEVGLEGAKKWGHAKEAFKEWANLLARWLGEYQMPKTQSNAAQ